MKRCKGVETSKNCWYGGQRTVDEREQRYVKRRILEEPGNISLYVGGTLGANARGDSAWGGLEVGDQPHETGGHHHELQPRAHESV